MANKIIVTIILVYVGYTFWNEGRRGTTADSHQSHRINRTEGNWNVYIHGRLLCEGPSVTYTVGSTEVKCD